MKHLLPVLLAAVFAWPCCALDTLEGTGGTTTTGFFLGYDKGTFNFMDQNEKSLHERPSGVKKLTLDKPLKAKMEMKTRRNAQDDVVLTGFEQGMFLIERAGKPEKVSLFGVAELRIELSNNRSMNELKEKDSVISKGEAVDLSKVPEDGKITILHFHQPGLVSSERQGNYVETLEKSSKGKIVLKRVVVPDGSAPVAKQLNMTSFPQFWFYGKNGQVAAKLTDRFTEQDINDAVKKASK